MPELFTPTVRLNLVNSTGPQAPQADLSAIRESNRGARLDLTPLIQRYQQVEQQKQVVLAQAQIQDEALSLKQKTNDLLSQYEQLKAKDAVDALPKIRRQLEQLAQESSTRATAYQPLVKDAITRNNKQILFDENARASQHQLSEAISWRDQTVNGLMAEAEDNALYYKNNPEMYNKYITELKQYKAQWLDNYGIPEGSDAWRAAMRETESAVHSTNILDDIERDNFAPARQKLDALRTSMDQTEWLRLDRMLLAKQQAWADAQAGKGSQTDTLINYFNVRHNEWLTSDKFKAERDGLLEQIRSETVIETLKNKDGTDYLDDNENPYYVYRPKTEEEVQAEYARRSLMAAENYAQLATMEFKQYVEGRTDFNKRNVQFVNNQITEYINETKALGSYPSVVGFMKFNSKAYQSLVGRHDGDEVVAQQELQKTLNAYYNFNPNSNAAIVLGFEDFLENASEDELRNMTTEIFDRDYGSYMKPLERLEYLRKLENKKRNISNGFVDDNSKQIKNVLKGFFGDGVTFSVSPDDYGDADLIAQSEQGLWVYNYVAKALKNNPSLTSNSNLTAAVTNIISDPTFLMEKWQHDQSMADTRDAVREFLDDQGIDSSQAFVAWVMQNKDNLGKGWRNFTDAEKRAVASTYEAVFAAKFDPSVFEVNNFKEAEFNDLMRSIEYGMTGVSFER